MARADLASASARTDSIKGLAQSIANPAYRRLLIAEPALRRAVPALIVAFLLTIGVGAVVQVLDHRRQAIAEALDNVEMIATFVAERFDHLAAAAKADVSRRDMLDQSLTSRATDFGRRIIITNTEGVITATAPNGGPIGQRLNDVLGDAQPLTILGQSAGAIEITLSDGQRAFATEALAAWRSDTTLTVTLSATTGFVLLILGFAFHWQSMRAREADLIYDTVRSRIDTALNRGRCGLWDWDIARGRIFWSHSMFAILGLRPRDDLMTFGEVSKLVHPDDIELYQVAAQLADAKTSAIDHEFRMLHANGRWVWLRARCEIVNQHLIGIAVDVTEQKSLVEQTATADIRLRDAIETIPEAFVLWDQENRLVLCNSNFQALHRLPDELIAPGTSYEQIVAAGRKHVIRNVSSEGPVIPGARTFETQLDDGHWLQISERRTKDGGYVSVGTDITPLKLNEKKLIESEKRLIATVADLRNSQHKLEVQAQQLTSMAQKYSDEKNRAEEANQAKSKFLANMSHELRTPLNAIIGFSEIMESGMFGDLGADKYHEYCRDIRTSGQFLLDVINDILDMSKIEAGRIKLELETVELDKILADALRVVSSRAQDKRLLVSSKIAAGITFKADRRSLKQIALNLLSNAVKFTPEKGKVTVRGRLARGGVVIAIQDTGIGIARDALAKLGRPFEQVESQFTKTQHGSGLGLAIAKSLIQLHGGVMRIRSTPGVGTTVIFRLPLDGQPAEKTETSVSAA